MFRKTSRIVAAAALVVGTLAGVGAAHKKAEQPLHAEVCCGSPPPACPGSPMCPATKK
jgi:hypothetical protein